MEIFAFIGLTLIIASLAFGVVKARGIIKNPLSEIDYKKELTPIVYGLVAFCGGFILLAVGLFALRSTTPEWYEYLQGYLGAFILGASIYSFMMTFIIHYYRKDIPVSLDKWLYRILLISIPCMICFLFVFSNGYAKDFTYPLVNGINFEHGFSTINTAYGPNIAFYAICILLGAVFVYFLCDHKMYVQYGKHGLLESTFLVAFPAGILGARLFYVIGNWSLEFAGKEWWRPFAIWEGGLTILGGAIMGIVIGVAWFMWRNKGYNIFVAVDIIVPTILLAQAIGRWGNFFNCEVHGVVVSDQYFAWLPTVILENIRFSDTAGFAGDGNVFVPLFLIESMMNILGYFLIAELFGRKLRKYTKLGDLAFGYIIWYGLVRATLEPLRYGAYNMGEDGFWSWIWSVCFIAIGMLLIAANHIIRHFINKHKKVANKEVNKVANIVTLSIFVFIAVSLIIPGSILMSMSNIPAKLEYNPFMVGIILVIVAVGFIFLASIPSVYLIDSKRKSVEA